MSAFSTFFSSRKTKLVAVAAGALLPLAMASAAIAGSFGKVVVETNPPGARVSVGGHVVGTTPASLQLPAGTKTRIKLTKPGYKTKSLSLTPKSGKAQRVKVKLKKK